MTYVVHNKETSEFYTRKSLATSHFVNKHVLHHHKILIPPLRSCI